MAARWRTHEASRMSADFPTGGTPRPPGGGQSGGFKEVSSPPRYRDEEAPPYEHRSPALRVLRGGGRSDLTLEELAVDMEVTKAAVSRWLSGKRPWPRRLTEVLLEDWRIEPRRVELAMASAAERRERFLQDEESL